MVATLSGMTAILSGCGTYRYRLTRDLSEPLSLLAPTGPAPTRGTLLFAMLNPSTADATVNDPTIVRCMGFGRTLGFRRIEVVNYFALRATNPKALYGHPDPVGPDNDYAVLGAAKEADMVIVAWGAHATKVRPARKADMLALLRVCKGGAHALRINADGSPAHPLYLPAASMPVAFGVAP